MKRFSLIALVVVLTLLGQEPNALAAQLPLSRSILRHDPSHGQSIAPRAVAFSLGGILDWINHLSGPGPFLRVGLTAHQGVSPRVAVRGAVLGGSSLSGPNVTIVTGQLTCALAVGVVEVAGGVALNHFNGGGFSALNRISFPAQAAIRVIPRLAIGGGVHVFIGLTPTDFGASFSVRRRTEAVVGAFLRFEP